MFFAVVLAFCGRTAVNYRARHRTFFLLGAIVARSLWGQPPDEKDRRFLGSRSGSSDRDYYLAVDGSVWCFDSPNNMYSRACWYPIPEEEWDKVQIEGKSLRQLVEERRP